MLGSLYHLITLAFNRAQHLPSGNTQVHRSKLNRVVLSGKRLYTQVRNRFLFLFWNSFRERREKIFSPTCSWAKWPFLEHPLTINSAYYCQHNRLLFVSLFNIQCHSTVAQLLSVNISNKTTSVHFSPKKWLMFYKIYYKLTISVIGVAKHKFKHRFAAPVKCETYFFLYKF